MKYLIIKMKCFNMETLQETWIRNSILCKQREAWTERPKLVPGAEILSAKFQLEGLSRLIESQINELIIIVINYIVSFLFLKY